MRIAQAAEVGEGRDDLVGRPAPGRVGGQGVDIRLGDNGVEFRQQPGVVAPQAPPEAAPPVNFASPSVTVRSAIESASA